MEDTTPKVNLVVYLVAKVAEASKTKPKFHLGGHGYTYNVAQEGKKKLAKDVPTSTGYYTGNPQKANTVVVVEDILTLTVPQAHSFYGVLIKGFLEILRLANSRGQKNLWVVTPHRELEHLVKTKGSKVELDGEDTALLEQLLIELAVLEEDKERKLFFDLPGAAEGGMGNREANKQLDIAEMAFHWAQKKEPHLDIMSRKDYENPEVNFNKIVDASRWYFSTNTPDKFYGLLEGYRVYGFGKVEPDKNYYGKHTPDVTYSKLYTTKPIELLDRMFEFTRDRIKNPDGYLSAGDLRQLVSKDVARLIDTVPAVPDKLKLVSPFIKQNGRPVLIELIKPVMMSYQVREYLQNMDTIFHAFMKRDADNKSNYNTFYDITDEVYVKEVNGKGVTKLKMHPEFNQLRSVIKVSVHHPNSVKPVPIMMSVGYDIPARNSFSSIEDPDVKVWACVDTRNEKGLRFCCVVQTNEFIYVHTSAVANLRVLTLAEIGKKA